MKKLSCPDCGSNSVSIVEQESRITFGGGEDAVELTVMIPVHNCSNCGMKYTGAEAGKRKHSALCKYLRDKDDPR